MDAIESGIVKVPRPPVDDDAKGDELVYLHLWDNIEPPLPRRVKRSELSVANWTIPKTLEGALQSLYRSYARGYSRYRDELAELGEPPPVMIVVCPNTAVSKLVFDWIAGWEKELDDGASTLVPGELELLSNVEDGAWAARQRTILIDTVQLESGEPLGRDFKQDAAHEIEAFKHEFRRRNPGADVAKIDDAALLREAMNTVGKRGKLGEQIRCVVSVGMLTEGWDANTVTHILGVRPFRSQLLCEQVVGRGLRRRSYAVNEENRLEPEYAEVYGVPFAFIPSDKPVPKPRTQRPPIEVRALPERDELAIEFPKLDGYRIELPDERLHADFTGDSRMHLDQAGLALWVETGGVIGEREQIDLDQIREARPQVLVTYDQFGNYGHPDHIQAHRVAMYGAQLAAARSYREDLGEPWETAKIYWAAMSENRMREGLRALRAAGDTTTFEGIDPDADMGFWVTPDRLLDCVVDGNDFVEAKMSAMKAHATQITVDGPFFALSNNVGNEVWGTEYYRLAKGEKGPVNEDGLETDLFAGLE